MLYYVTNLHLQPIIFTQCLYSEIASNDGMDMTSFETPATQDRTWYTMLPLHRH